MNRKIAVLMALSGVFLLSSSLFSASWAGEDRKPGQSGALTFAEGPTLPESGVKVEQNKDSVKIENRFIKAVISARGGKISVLYDKQARQEYALGPSVDAGSGLFKDRIWEKADWNELFGADFKLEILSNTPKEATVRAQYRALSGPGKGMDFVHTYTLKADECRLKVNYRIFANELWGEFSPWLHNVVNFPGDFKNKNTVAIFSQTGRGLFSDTPSHPKFESALLFDCIEPWIGAVSEIDQKGLCMVVDAKRLNHFYCWYGAEYFFTMEPIFKKEKFAPGSSWSTDIWFIPTQGLGSYHLATAEYVGGLTPEGLKIFPAVSLPEASATIVLDKGKPETLKPEKVEAGKAVVFPFKVRAGTHDLKFQLAANGKDYDHAVRANSERCDSEVIPATQMGSSSAAVDNAAALYSKNTIYLSPDMPVSIHFGMADNFKEKGKKVELVLEIPENSNVINPSGNPVTEKFLRSGKPYTKYRFSGQAQSYYNWCSMFMSTTLKPGAKDNMYYYVVWEGGAQKPQLLTIESVKIEACKKTPKRLLAGLGFYGTGEQKRWPDIYKNLQRVGLNTVSLSDYDCTKIPDMKEAVLKAKNAGMYTTANYSPTCAIPGLKNNSDAWAEAADGTRTGEFICPAYRGPVLDEEISRATSYAEAGASIIFWDAESWRGREFCFCPRCIGKFEVYFKKHYPRKRYLSPKIFELDPQQYPEYHAAWLEFRISIGTELFRKYKDEYLRRLKLSGVGGTGPAQLIIGSYDVMPGRIYHQFQRFEELYAAGAVNICMPSLYVAGDALKVGNTVKDVRKAIGKARIILWITGGSDDSFECDGIDQKYILLELFLNGATGFTTWPYLGWDALDVKYLSQVMNMVTPLEDIIMDGKVMENLTASNQYVRTAGLVKGKEAAILISDYYHDALPAVTLKLNSPAPSGLFDVATGKKLAVLKAGANSIELPAYPEKARLLYIGKKAPVTSY
ncbi:MAG: hypothetical protein NTY10_04670 [Candidatus Omnitrophica bacterium]|nr:hypothetical protein [Candidatus Omnitrophota bacterium]